MDGNVREKCRILQRWSRVDGTEYATIARQTHLRRECSVIAARRFNCASLRSPPLSSYVDALSIGGEGGSRDSSVPERRRRGDGENAGTVTLRGASIVQSFQAEEQVQYLLCLSSLASTERNLLRKGHAA